jgi:DNA-binding NtrC family response regulator
LKILVIDDEEFVRDALEMVLARQGHSPVTLGSAVEAVVMLSSQDFDLILTDIVMPEMDGIAFIKAIRKNGITTPVITLTGGARVGQKNMSTQALKAGACYALRKPVDKQQIIDAIEAAINP